MKNERVILVIFLILIGITFFAVFGHISYLKEQNKVLSINIGQIMKRISMLESDKTMEKITTLKIENVALKKQIGDLEVELKRISKKVSKPSNQKTKQAIKEQKKKEKSITGNKGFLIKKI